MGHALWIDVRGSGCYGARWEQIANDEYSYTHNDNTKRNAPMVCDVGTCDFSDIAIYFYRREPDIGEPNDGKLCVHHKRHVKHCE